MFCIHVKAFLDTCRITCKKPLAVTFELVVLSIIYYVFWNGNPCRSGQIASRLIKRRWTDINIIIILY